MDTPRIHITGASGAGVTTLGRALATRLGVEHLDTDRFYWLPTDPPFQQARAIRARLDLLADALGRASGGWVLSGSIGRWGEPVVPLFQLAVFVLTPTEVRLERLARREAEVFGHGESAPGGPMHEHVMAFLDWASRYDHGDREGRSRAFHEAWLAGLSCPVLRLEGTVPAEVLAVDAERAWRATHASRAEL